MLNLAVTAPQTAAFVCACRDTIQIVDTPWNRWNEIDCSGVATP